MHTEYFNGGVKCKEDATSRVAPWPAYSFSHNFKLIEKSNRITSRREESLKLLGPPDSLLLKIDPHRQLPIGIYSPRVIALNSVSDR